MHALYLIDSVEKDPVSREQLVRTEKAFEVAESGRLSAVADLKKVRAEKAEVSKKLDLEKKARKTLQEENVKLTDEVADLSDELERLKLVEESVKELTAQVESLPSQVSQAAKDAAERAVEEFKKSPEFAALLRQQHLKSVSENVKLYRDRGWLNIEKFRADREAELAAARLAQEAKEAEASREGEEVPILEEGAQVEGGGGSTESRDRSSTSVPKTPGLSGPESL